MRTKLPCKYCSRLISKSNYSKHIRSHENGNYDKNLNTENNRYNLDHDDLNCKFCKRLYNTKNALIQHEIRCKLNPTRLNVCIPNFNNNGRTAWNKNLTKESDLRVKNYSQTFSKNAKLGLHKSRHYSEEAKLKLKMNNKMGGYRPGSGYGKAGWYKNIHCDSTYELVYVIYCLDHDISFTRCKRTYEYEYEGKIHKYHPDFELDDGTLIEIKGYYTPLVDIKTNSVHDRPIHILYFEDLKYMFEYVRNNYSYDKLTDLYENA